MVANADFPTAATYQSAVAGTLGALQYAAYKDMVDKQDAIAKRIQQRADDIHTAWAEIYLPRESEIVNAIYSIPEYVPQTSLRSLEAQAEVARQFAIAKKNTLYCLAVSCEGAVCDTERKISIAEARAKAWQIQSAVRQEEAKADVKNAQIRADKVQVLNIGRGHVTSSSSMLQAAAGIYQTVGAQSAAANNALASTIGGVFRQFTGSDAGAQQPRNSAMQLQANNFSIADTNTNTGGLGLKAQNLGGFGSTFSLNGSTPLPGSAAVGVGPGFGTQANGTANGSTLTTQPSLGDSIVGGS